MQGYIIFVYLTDLDDGKDVDEMKESRHKLSPEQDENGEEKDVFCVFAFSAKYNKLYNFKAPLHTEWWSFTHIV